MKERNKPTKSFVKRSIEEIEKEAFQEGNGGLIVKMWIARTKGDRLSIFDKKPHYSECEELWLNWLGESRCLLEAGYKINSTDFPEVTFENSPMEVGLKLIEK